VAITLVPAFSVRCRSWIELHHLDAAAKQSKQAKRQVSVSLALCLCDVFNSLTFVFWSLPIPKGTPGVWGTMGNKASCKHGFLNSIWDSQTSTIALCLCISISHCAFNMKDEQIAKILRDWIYHYPLRGVWDCSWGFTARLVQSQWCGLLYAPEPL
jgi:hypothetical protein